MFSFLRIPAFLFAFVFLFFGPQAVGFAAENPSRLSHRLEELAPSAEGVRVFAPPGALAQESNLSAKSGDYLNFITLQVSRVKWATVLFAPTMARADEPAVPGIEPSDFQKLLEAIGGAKGAGAMGIALIVVQVLMLLAKAIWRPTAGWQLTLVLGLSLGAGILSLMVIGKLDFGAALVHSTTLAAIQVFLNQVFKKATAPA